MFKTIAALLVLAITPVLARATTALPGNAAHGEKLYQENCAACHASQFGGNGSMIFVRKGRSVHSIKGLYRQVGACNTQMSKMLSNSERQDVVKYLDSKYYKF
ncbi:MAG: c-type cytochrome [Acidiferrobacterales bacterium]